jgi:hypothetical protein
MYSMKHETIDHGRPTPVVVGKRRRNMRALECTGTVVSDAMNKPELTDLLKQHVCVVVTVREFLQRFRLRVIAISTVLLIPCFWLRHIEADDLGSHVYNAWLAQLVRQGRAPGLWVKHIWDNVLFDWMLSGFTSIFGFGLGEKMAVSLAVLLLFWGVFAFVSAISHSAPWTLLPAVAMLAYGWTFQHGLLNYYLAIGLSFWALSIWCVTRGRNRLYAVAFTPLMFFAHPLGLGWFLGAALYIFIADRVPQRLRVYLPAAAGLLLLLMRRFMWHPWHRFHFRVGNNGDSVLFYNITGMDQFVIYNDNQYRLLAGALLLFVMACLLWEVARRWREEDYWSRWRVPLQLYIVVELGVLLFPDIVHIPRYAAPISLLRQRFGLVSAILILALLGMLRKRAWHAVGFGLFGCVFFFLFYQDTARTNLIETRVEQLVSKLPFGTRVMATILLPAGTQPHSVVDLVDRACIERCFSFGNYEPSSAQFRVRALPGNGIVTTNYLDSIYMEGGRYVVKPQDLPVYQVYRCSSLLTDLCIRKLEAGETNDRLGVHP